MTTKFRRVSVNQRTRLLALRDVLEIADHLRRGGATVLPTDTGYMLSVAADDPQAVTRVFNTKGRAALSAMHVACGSPTAAEKLGAFDIIASRLLYELLPGAMSLVVPTRGVTDGRLLVDGTVGIRIPACAATLQVLQELEHPVTATSCNRSGQPAITVPSDDALEALDWDLDSVVVVEDAAAQAHERPSTMVRVVGGEITMLRQGPITEAELREIAASPTYLEIRDWT